MCVLKLKKNSIVPEKNRHQQYVKTHRQFCKDFLKTSKLQVTLSTSENGSKRLLISSRPVHIAVSSRNSNQEVHKSSLSSLKSCIFMESWNIKRLFGSKSSFEVNFDLKPSVSLFVGRKKLRYTSFFFVFCSNFLVLGIGAPRTGQTCLKLIGGWVHENFGNSLQIWPGSLSKPLY